MTQPSVEFPAEPPYIDNHVQSVVPYNWAESDDFLSHQLDAELFMDKYAKWFITGGALVALSGGVVFSQLPPTHSVSLVENLIDVVVVGSLLGGGLASVVAGAIALQERWSRQQGSDAVE